MPKGIPLGQLMQNGISLGELMLKALLTIAQIIVLCYCYLILN